MGAGAFWLVSAPHHEARKTNPRRSNGHRPGPRPETHQRPLPRLCSEPRRRYQCDDDFGDEGKGAATLGSGLDTIKAVMDALEAAGIELLGHGQPGVRLRAKERSGECRLARDNPAPGQRRAMCGGRGRIARRFLRWCAKRRKPKPNSPNNGGHGREHKGNMNLLETISL
jgi:hypothetical protein